MEKALIFFYCTYLVIIIYPFAYPLRPDYSVYSAVRAVCAGRGHIRFPISRRGVSPAAIQPDRGKGVLQTLPVSCYLLPIAILVTPVILGRFIWRYPRQRKQY